MTKLLEIYRELLNIFGQQHWWPMQNGFEPMQWEVCIGAVLTQNTNWKNVEIALGNLKNAGILSVADVLRTKNNELEKLIKSSGFYKQKAKKLKTLANFVNDFGCFDSFLKKIKRDELLKVNGIGPETADSILLYAGNRPCFVIDAYTKRIFSRLGFFEKNEKYEEIRNFFEKSLPKNAKIYNEFHALIVKMGKDICKKKPKCEDCVLSQMCKKLL